ncbi:hypothetical protein MOSE0_D05776 [Monosporozyma servazzii]
MQRKEQTSLVELVVKALRAIDQHNYTTKVEPHSIDDLEEVVYALIQVLRHIDWNSGIKLFPQHDLTEFTSIFTNILTSKIEFKTELVTVLLAYFSIHPSLNQLIINSSCQWDLYFTSDNNNNNNNNTTKQDLFPGFYTVIKEIEKFKTFNKKFLSFMQYNFPHTTLINSWIPMWNLKRDNNKLDLNWDYYLNQNLLPNLFKEEAMTDFFLANNMNNGQLDITQATNIEPLLFKLYPRMVLLDEKWVNKKVYNQVLHNLLNLDDNHTVPLNFALQILMEIIDHPEYNYLEESKLVILLHLALVKLEKTPVTQLHTALSEIGSSQSLLAIVNLTQFFIAQFLNKLQLVNERISTDDLNKLQTGNTPMKFQNEQSSSDKKNKLSKFEIPSWFKDEILPDIPPIAKSLFIFDTPPNNYGSIKLSFTESLNVLFDCLNLTILIHNNIINQYHALKINLLQLDSSEKNDINVNIEYLSKQHFFQLNYIPIFTAMLTIKNIFKDGTTHLLPANGVNSTKKVITLNFTKYVESLIISYKDIALYHLLKFISTISQENLIFQKISIQMLNHLFFHDNGNNFTFSLCKENKLLFNEISSYIRLWNDGTSSYSLFFTELFGEKQPMVNIKKIDLRQLQELIPYMGIVIKFQETPDKKKKSYEYKSKGTRNFNSSSGNYNTASNYGHQQSNNDNNISSNNNQNGNSGILTQPIQPIPLKNMKNYMTPTKYDAYSSPVFIPSHNSSANTTTVINSTTNNMVSAGTSFTPQPQSQPQHMFNPGIGMYSTPLSYMKQQQQQSINPMGGIDPSVDASLAIAGNISSLSGINPNEMYTPGNYTMQTNFMSTPQTLPLTHNNNNPNTSNDNVSMLNTTKPVFSSPWNESPTMTSHPSQNKIVNTGKNYILGGHNRVKNNSRAQSIHIDQFENV